MCSKSSSGSIEYQPSREVYEYFEHKRLKGLGLNEAYSNFYLKSRDGKPAITADTKSYGDKDSNGPQVIPNSTDTTLAGHNTLMPFCTFGKPTSGYAYNDEANYRRPHIDVPPADLTRYRFKATLQPTRPETSKSNAES